jgi:6-phosphogluconate dehydrogenase
VPTAGLPVGEDEPDLALLAAHPSVAAAIGGAVAAWRTVVAEAALTGVPAPAMASALGYYDALRAERLPAALVQGQRDLFGSHTYGRVDKPGRFHTAWSDDRREETTSAVGGD